VNTGRTVLIAILALALSSTAFGVSLAFARTEGRSSLAAAADTTKATKERVRKETPPPRAKEKPRHEEEASEEESSFWGDCLGSFLGSLCGSIFSGNENENEPPAPVVVVPASPPATAFDAGLSGPMRELPFMGMVEPLYGGGSEVGLYSRPGGAKASADVVEWLPEGTEVRAVQYGLFEENRWLLVSRNELGAPEGWVLEKEVIPQVPPSELAVGEAKEITPPGAPAGQVFEPAPVSPAPFLPQQPRWQIGARASLPVFAQKAIWEEYKNGAYEIGVETGFYFPYSMRLGLSFGYLHANGKPLYDYYVGGQIKDSPFDSDLEILSFGLPFGQSISFAGGSGFFGYGVGPAVLRVHEQALIREYEAGVPAGFRTDRLTSWKVGGEAVVSVGGILAQRVPVSLETRFALIPWSAAEEKSLTLDFLQTKDIGFFSFGIGIGFSTF
jgi:hypothetical protein